MSRGGPARILIVDDERLNRTLMEVILTGAGHVVSHASAGQEALDIVANVPVDLVLLDVMMPGLDGYQVAARLKADPRTNGIPIIMLTALDDRNSRMHGLSAGAADFLTKPVSRFELLDSVNKLLGPTE